MMINNNCFVYGTLMSPQVLQTLLGRIPTMTKPAYLHNYIRYPVKDHVYPGIIPCSKSSNHHGDKGIVEGILLSGLTKNEIKIFDWFEDTDYKRCIEDIHIILKDSKHGDHLQKSDISDNEKREEIVKANVYVWIAGNDLLEIVSDCTGNDDDKIYNDWSYNNFQQVKLEKYLKDTVKPCRLEIERLAILENGMEE